MPNCGICGAWTELTFTILPDQNIRLCSTCARFARLAAGKGYSDWWETFTAVEQAMIDNQPGFLESDRWLPEEVAVLDKFYTLSDVRHRLTWLSLSRSFRNIRRKDREAHS